MRPIDQMSDLELDAIAMDPRHRGTSWHTDAMIERNRRYNQKPLAAHSHTIQLPQGVTVTQAPNPWSLAGYHSGPNTWDHAPPPTKAKTQDCRCESRHLFAFGHEKPCDYYKENK